MDFSNIDLLSADYNSFEQLDNVTSDLFEQGEQISGKIIELSNDTVTIEIKNKQMTFDKDIFSDVSKGDIKDFEVIKVSSKQVVLKNIPSSEKNDFLLADTSRKKVDFNDKTPLIQGDLSTTEYDKNNTYLFKHELNQTISKDTANNISKEASISETSDTLKKVMVILSSDDLETMSEQGLDIEEMDIKTLYKTINNIHEQKDSKYKVNNHSQTNENIDKNNNSLSSKQAIIQNKLDKQVDIKSNNKTNNTLDNKINNKTDITTDTKANNKIDNTTDIKANNKTDIKTDIKSNNNYSSNDTILNKATVDKSKIDTSTENTNKQEGLNNQNTIKDSEVIKQDIRQTDIKTVDYRKYDTNHIKTTDYRQINTNDIKTADYKQTDTNDIYYKQNYNKQTDYKLTDIKQNNNKQTDYKLTDIKQNYNKQIDHKLNDSKQIDSNKIDSKQIDSNKTDLNQIDYKLTNTKTTDYKQVYTRQIDNKQTDLKTNDIKQNNINLSNKDYTNQTDSNKINTNQTDFEPVNSNKINTNQTDLKQIDSNKINPHNNDFNKEFIHINDTDIHNSQSDTINNIQSDSNNNIHTNKYIYEEQLTSNNLGNKTGESINMKVSEQLFKQTIDSSIATDIRNSSNTENKQVDTNTDNKAIDNNIDQSTKLENQDNNTIRDNKANQDNNTKQDNTAKNSPKPHTDNKHIIARNVSSKYKQAITYSYANNSIEENISNNSTFTNINYPQSEIEHINSKKVTTTGDFSHEVNKKSTYDCGIVDKSVDKINNNTIIKDKTSKNTNNSNYSSDNLQSLDTNKNHSSTNKLIEDENIIKDKIIQKIKDNNIEVTDKLVDKIKDSIHILDGINIDDDIKKYMIDKDIEPTINNLYKASYISKASNSINDTSYQPHEYISDNELSSIMPQIEKILISSGKELTDKNIDKAKWLVKNDLALDKENLDKLELLEKVKSSDYLDDLVEKIISNVTNGTLPNDARLDILSDREIETQVKEIINVLPTISDKAIKKVIEKDEHITIENLVKEQEKIDISDKEDLIKTENIKEYKDIKASNNIDSKEYKNDNLGSKIIETKYSIETRKERLDINDREVKDNKEPKKESYDINYKNSKDITDIQEPKKDNINIKDISAVLEAKKESLDTTNINTIDNTEHKNYNIDINNKATNDITNHIESINNNYSKDTNITKELNNIYNNKNINKESTNIYNNENIKQETNNKSYVAFDNKDINNNAHDNVYSKDIDNNSYVNVDSKNIDNNAYIEGKSNADVNNINNNAHIEANNKATNNNANIEIDIKDIDYKSNTKVNMQDINNNTNVNADAKKLNNANNSSNNEAKPQNIDNNSNINVNNKEYKSNDYNASKEYKTDDSIKTNDSKQTDSIKTPNYNTLESNKTDYKDIKDTNNINYKNIDTNDINYKNIDIEVIKTRRDIEEICLKMTVSAGKTLVKNGIDINKKEMADLIDELNKIEDNYYKSLLKDDELDSFPMDTLKDTVSKIDDLKYMPVSSLAMTFDARKVITLNELHQTGSELLKQIPSSNFTKFESTFEAVMTKPRKDMGDSIKKAFTNIDDILEDLNIETTDTNRRAVRILGYNSIPITEENIGEMKLYDAKVNELIRNLTPSTCVDLIRENINPLTMPIDELNEVVVDLKNSNTDLEEESYSKFLWELEHKKGIDSKERESYIGIYRLINAIKKSDGAIIGATINSKKELTLSNILESARSNTILNGKKGGIDVNINDDFGLIEELIKDDRAIDKQINSAFTNNDTNTNKFITSNNDTNLDKDTSSINPTYKKVKHQNNNINDRANIRNDNNTNADDILVTDENINNTNTDYSMYLLRNIANSLSADNLTNISSKGIDILNTPIEHLMEVLSEMEENIQNKEEKNYYRQKLNDLRNVVDKNDNLVRLLSNSNMQVTINNILSSSEMLDGSGLAKSIKDSLKKDKEKQKDIESKIDKLLSHMDSEDDTNNYYIEMANSINSYLNDAKNKCIDANEMKSLIRASKNMAFAINMTKQKSYDIPMVINDDVTNVHLTIIDKHSPNSRISINYTSEQLGHTNIEFSIKNDVIDGYIISDNPDMINALKNNNSNLENGLTSYNLRVKQIAYGTKKSLNYDYIFNDNNVEAKNSNKQLYSISKMLITNIKNIHNNLTKI